MEYRQLQLDQLRRNIETMEDLRDHPVYLFNADRFIQNFTDLQNEFRKIYPNTRIAYSYKTKHIPGIGHLVDKLGGYAEVVSPMELRIARVDAGCEWNHIIYNGLLRDDWMLNLMKSGGMVNVESMECLQYILESVNEPLKIGIRFGEPDSRFGFQESELFDVMGQIAASNIRIAGIHCHIGGSRSMETWKRKTERMVRIVKDIEQTMKYPLEYIDLGGHLFGRMDDELREQFGDVPTFRGYAKTVANNMLISGRQAATNTVNAIVNFFTQLPGKIQTWLSNTISKLVSWGSQMAARGRSAASQLVNAVTSGVAGLPGKMAEVGSNIVRGVWNGISNSIGWFKSQVNSFFSGIVDGAKSALGIHSPSRVFAAEVGAWIPPGVGEGIKDKMPELENETSKEMKALAQRMQTAVSIETGKISIDKNTSQTFKAEQESNRTPDDRETKVVIEGETHVHVDLDGKEIAEVTTPYIDENLGKRYDLEERGV